MKKFFLFVVLILGVWTASGQVYRLPQGLNMGSRQWCYDGYALVETNDEHAYVYITRGAYPEIKTLVPFYQIEEQVMGRLEAICYGNGWSEVRILDIRPYCNAGYMRWLIVTNRGSYYAYSDGTISKTQAPACRRYNYSAGWEKTMAWLYGTYRFLDCVTYAAYAWDHTMHCLKAIGNGIKHGTPDMTPYGGRYTPVYREPYHHRYDRPVRYSNSRPRIVKTRQLEKRENRRPVRDVRQQDSRKPVRSTVKKQTSSSNSGSTPLLDKYLSRK